jgi:5-hydroxyisourate hydrolase
MSASLSTHVLDTSDGLPAAGVLVEVWHDGALVASGRTDAQGRVRELATDLSPGVVQVVFHPPSTFFRRVALDVDLRDGHHHVPLLVSPYGCASYRGS